MNFDNKEQQLLMDYKSKFEQELFDEKDVYSFLVFIRDHLKKTKLELNYIADFGDTIAHRNRDRGVAMRAIQSAIISNYQTEENLKTVVGYDGIKYEDWAEQWKKLGAILNINFSDDIIHDITICVFSLLQCTEYCKCAKVGYIKLVQGRNNKLAICTTEGKSNSKYIGFFVLDNVDFKKVYECGMVDEILKTIRENGKLRLVNDNNDYII